MNNLARFVGELEIIPKGYGVAYREYTRHGSMCYPIPMNLLVRFVRGMWLWAKIPMGTTWYEAIEFRAYDRGRQVGMAIGETQGYEKALETMREMIREIKSDE